MGEPRMPSVFVSHGAPTLILTDCPARDFLKGLATSLPRPSAVVCVSAHWETEVPTVGAAPRPATIHDFHGFPEALSRLRYPAPGAPELARRAAGLLAKAGLESAIDRDRGLDHGAWAPLLLMYPKADVPVIQCSIQHPRGCEGALALGRALAPLRDEGVLILGSGGAVHNLRYFRPEGDAVPEWAARFDDWLAQVAASGDADRLALYRTANPDGTLAHPRDEHLLPFAAALGAGAGAKGRALHRGFMDGALSMAAYAFG